MSAQPQGPAPQAQPGNGEQPPVQQPTQQTPQQPNPAAPASQPQTPAVSVEELQRQIAERDEKLRLATESSRHWQSQADRYKAQTQALTGVQPQQDPLAEDVKFFVSQGYDEKDARIFAEFTNRKVSALAQQNQTLQQSLQATNRTGQLMQSLIADQQLGPMFADQEVQSQVHQMLQQAAISGQHDLVNPGYAVELAKLAWADKHKPWAPQTQQPQAQPQAQPLPTNFQFLGPQPTGLRPAPAQSQAKPNNPFADQLAQQMAQYTGIQIQPNQ